MNISLKQLEAIVTVADRGNFTRAAAALGTTQPALSLQVRELEDELGLRLFDRTTRRVEPTRAGVEFIIAARKMLGDLRLAVSNAADLANRQRGRIAIAAPPLLASAVLPRVIATFGKLHPGIEITVWDVASDRIVEKVMSGEADLGLGTFTLREPSLSATTLVRDRLMLFCPAGSPLAQGAPQSWASVADEPQIMLTRESGLRFLVDHGFELVGRSLKPAFEVSQIGTALAMVEAGLGVAILPAYAGLIAEQRRVVTYALEDPVLTREISIIRSQDRSIQPGADEFCRILARQVQQLMARIRG